VSEQIDEILLDAEEKMTKAIAVAREDFATIRTGRATSAMFNKVFVEYYGTPTPVNQLASIQIPEPRSVLITPYDKGSFTAIEKALRESDLGINPNNDGQVIRVNLPTLTEERRREYIKVAKHKAEEARVSVRNVRRHAKDHLDRLQKDGEAGEDDVRRAEKHLDDLTHKHVEHIDEVLKNKEAELLEV
jgi:ribosome recycling factor